MHGRRTALISLGLIKHADNESEPQYTPTQRALLGTSAVVGASPAALALYGLARGEGLKAIDRVSYPHLIMSSLVGGLTGPAINAYNNHQRGKPLFEPV